ncbi:MAG: hypothetical protein NVS3B10_27590 [Polyangiales bacterium]
MPTLSFASAIARHVACPTMTVEAASVGAALELYFASHPRVRAYVLDEQGAVRHHVAIFVDGTLRRGGTLDTPLSPSADVHVMQALSGG